MMKAFFDCATGESGQVPMTPEEIAAYETAALAQAEANAAREAEDQAIAQAKADALAELKALGLSDAAIAALTA